MYMYVCMYVYMCMYVYVFVYAALSHPSSAMPLFSRGTSIAVMTRTADAATVHAGLQPRGRLHPALPLTQPQIGWRKGGERMEEAQRLDARKTCP